MENINELLAKSPSNVPIKINNDDPEVAAQVAEFLKEVRAEEGIPDKDATEEKSPVVDIRPPDDPLFQKSQHDVVLTEALVNTENTEISLEEKSIFLKALLNEVPVELPVSLFAGKLVIELRSRTNHEQQRIFDTLNKEVESGRIEKTNFALQITRFQQLCMAIMIQRINGKLFSELQLHKGSKLEADSAELLAFIEDKVAGMDSTRWTALLNAMRIFETKIAKMSGEASNEDFWKPRASV